MNDKLITKIIAKIHRKLLVFLGLLFFVFFVFFVALLEGFTISHLKLGDITLKQVYLKWDNALHINARLIDLSNIKNDESAFDPSSLQHLPSIIEYAEAWVSTINIQSLRYDNTNISIAYTKAKIGKIHVQNRNISLNGTFNLTPEFLRLVLLTPKNTKNTMDAQLFVNIANQNFTLASTLQLPSMPLLQTHIHGDKEKLSIDLNSSAPFQTITPLVDFIGIDPIVRPWVVEYAEFQSAKLHSCKGTLFYDKPQKLLENLSIHARAYNASYTFDPKIAPIKAPEVDLSFEHGKLHIYPRNGTFYTLPAQKSHLNIDFLTPHVMLNAFIRSNKGQLNDDILYLLDHYNIKVPVRQNKGAADVDLNLSINLHDISINANGVFIPTDSEIELDGFRFATKGGKVLLNNSKVHFEGFNATYENLANGSVDGSFDASSGYGKIIIAPKYLYPMGPKSPISLRTTSSTKVIYRIDPKQDTLEISPTIWDLYGKQLHINKALIPYDFHHHRARLSHLPFAIGKSLSGVLNAELSDKQWSAKLSIERFAVDEIKLLSPNVQIGITPKNEHLQFSVANGSQWNVGGELLSFSPLLLEYKDQKIILNPTNMLLKEQFSAMIHGEYSPKSYLGSLEFTNINPINTKINRYIDTSRGQKLLIDTSKDEINLHSNDLGIDLSSSPYGWKMDIDDISTISKRSALLRYYKIDKGYGSLIYSTANKRVTFNGAIEYPYHLMMVNGKSLSTYRFNGTMQDGKTTIRINDRLTITNDQVIGIRANNMGINGPELLRWITRKKENSTQSSSDPSDKSIVLNGTNLYFHLMENRKILADSLQSTLNSDGLDGRLTFGDGYADITLRGDMFYATGEHFGERFMENIFAFSDFDGGDLSFKISGKTDHFEGIVKIDKTTLKEYKVLNNVLSFINTIPSLTTFSLPNYSSKGLFVNDTYAHFTYNNHLFDIDTYVLNSAELKIIGNAQANMMNDTLNGTMTLKTDLGSTLGKVPLVGYILLGDDGSISTTLNLSGKLSDPKVETGIAKEVVSAPFNILKRTVTYPFLWMIPDEKKK